MLRLSLLGLTTVIFGFSGLFVGSGRAQSPDEVAALVRQLGDDAFSVRNAASERLSAMGLAAHDGLIAGLKNADPEIRRNCRWILASVLQADLNRRIGEFEADVKDERDHNIPCWPRFKAIAGNDENARKLFLEMLKAEGNLLESAASGDVADSLDLRIRQIVQPMYDGSGGPRKPTSLGSSAAILFLCGDAELTLPQSVREHNFLMSVVQQQEFMKALNEGPFQPAAKKLLGQWIVAPATINMQFTKLQLAVQYGVDSGLDLALKLVKDSQTPAHFRSYSISAIGALGGKDYASILQGMLEDKTAVFNGTINMNGKNIQMTTEVRDLALAWLIFLTEQDHADYGMEQGKKEFENVKKNRRNQPNFVMLGFTEAAKRDAALAKWKAWVGEHPLAAAEEKPKIEIKTLEPQAQPVVPAAKIAGNAAPADDEKETLDGMTLEPADRAEMKRLVMARDLCENGQYGEGTRILDEILAADGDRAFRPSVKMPLYRCLKPEAERILGELPKEGRETYRLHFGVAARKALSEAMAKGDFDAVSEVASRYFHTQSGAEAAFLVADHFANAGQPFRAALHFQRIRQQSHDADRLEPALSLNQAVCALKSGLIQEACDAAIQLKKYAAGGKVAVAGKTIPVFVETEKALTWLEAFAGHRAAASLADGWLMYRGSPMRGAAAQVSAPSMEPERLCPISAIAAVVSAVDQFSKENIEQKRISLPRLHPLVVGQTILLRTATNLKALDAGSGELLWEAGLEDPFRALIAGGGVKEVKDVQAEPIAQSLRQRLWEDLTFGTMSADSRMVYGVEDVVFPLSDGNQRMSVGADGNRRLDSETLRAYNLLTAHDLKTGKLKWEIGGPKGEDSLPSAGVCFLGPPLPLGGKLYQVAQVNKETQLLELNAEDGALIGSLTLMLREDSANETMAFMPLPQLNAANSSSRCAGSSPSYADGILVCQNGESQYAAMSLATRTVRWVYQAPESDAGRNAMFGFNPMQRKARELVAAEQNGRWIDGSAVISDGRVLLTPADSNELICLSLADGCLLWTSPRRDGLFIGGAADGLVIVVGRSAVWAVRLEDGAPAWKGQPAQLPPGSLPSGSGVLAKGRFYLPLSTGEIAAVDLKLGRVVAHSRGADGVIPGNLAACGDTLLSQSAQGLWRYDSLAALDKQTAAALAEHKDDPESLRRRGEVLLAAGQIGEAIDLLARAAELKGDQASNRRLTEAVLEGLNVDFARFEGKSKELEAIIARSDKLGQLLRCKVEGLLAANRPADAFAACMRLADLDPPAAEGAEVPLVEVATGHLVRSDRWTAARMAEIRAAADPALAETIDREVAAQFKKGQSARFVAFFGWHPQAGAARIALAKEAMDKAQWLVAEQLLRDVLDSSSQELHPEAAARLAIMLRAANQPLDAADVYAVLDSELAATPCLDGKTGRELVAAIPADDPTRAAMRALPVWPGSKAKNDFDENAKDNAGITRFAIPSICEPGRFNRLWNCEVDGQNRQLCLTDASGRARCELAGPTDNNWNFINPYYACSQMRLRGRLAVGWLGNRVYAFNALAEKPARLWDVPTFTIAMPQQFANMGMPMRMRQPQQIPPLPGADLLPVVFSGGSVAMLQDRSLLLLDAQTGKPLWSRDDIAFESTLVGDGEVLLVTPADAVEAIAYSAMDGRELGRRPIAAAADRLWTLGRRVVVWKSSEQGMCLSLVDPWTQQTVYTRTFDPKAQVCLIEGDEAGVLDPKGNFNVLDLATGIDRLSASVEAPGIVERILVQRSETQYVLLAAGPPNQGNNMVIFNPGANDMRINGKAYGFDRPGGKHRWTVDVEEQAFRLGQRSDVPILVFFNQVQRLEGNQFHNRLKLLCVDKRNGKLIFEREAENQNGNGCSIVADVKAGTVEVRTTLGTAKIRFGEDPPTAAPKEEPAAAPAAAPASAPQVGPAPVAVPPAAAAPVAVPPAAAAPADKPSLQPAPKEQPPHAQRVSKAATR